MARDNLKRKPQVNYEENSYRNDSDYKPRSPISPEFETDNLLDELSDHVKAEFMSIGKARANQAAYHYIQIFLYLDENPKLALAEARKLIKLSTRLGTFRELLGVAYYYNGDYQSAMSELKAARRINGAPDYLPMIIDCYRGLERSKDGILYYKDDPEVFDCVSKLKGDIFAEFSISLAGAWCDLGYFDHAQKLLDVAETHPLSCEVKFRVEDARMYFYELAGDTASAKNLHDQLDPQRDDIEIYLDKPLVALDLLDDEGGK
jgi:tetratricopeptide (TPR) repeat protein